ncbi:MAG: Gfo/Idh/MocA family protein, partial [Planctomycetota bacterium]
MARSKNLKVAAGLQCRHSPARQALIEKIRNGEMGEVSYVRANRLGGSRWLGKEKDPNNFMNQLQFG